MSGLLLVGKLNNERARLANMTEQRDTLLAQRDALLAALEPFARANIDVSESAVILGYPLARKAMEAAWAAIALAKL